MGDAMTRNRWTILLVGTLLALSLLVAATRTEAHLVWDFDNGDQTVWNGDSAFIFIGASRLGWHGSYAKMLEEIVRSRFGAVGSAHSDKTSSVTVITITPTNIDRRTVADFAFGLYRGIGEHIYTRRRQSVMRWSGTTFEAATPEEIERVNATPWLKTNSIGPTDGWSSRCCMLSASFRGETTFKVGKQLILLRSQVYGAVKDLEIQRPNGPVETIWTLNERARLVTRREYSALFDR